MGVECQINDQLIQSSFIFLKIFSSTPSSADLRFFSMQVALGVFVSVPRLKSSGSRNEPKRSG